MKRLFLSVVLAVAAYLPFAAAAADWQPISKSVADRAEYFLDLDSVKFRQGRISGWVLTNYSRKRFEVASATDLYAVDCKANMIAHLNGGTYSEPFAQGKSLERYLGRTPNAEPVVAGTLGEKVLTELCKANPAP